MIVQYMSLHMFSAILVVAGVFRYKNHCNTFASSRNREFLRHNNRIARGLAREFLRSGKRYRPGQRLKRHGKSSSLHSKQIFLVGGCEFFVSGFISGGLLGHLGQLYLALGANR